jgi:hypothetical protein
LKESGKDTDGTFRAALGLRQKLEQTGFGMYESFLLAVFAVGSSWLAFGITVQAKEGNEGAYIKSPEAKNLVALFNSRKALGTCAATALPPCSSPRFRY